MNSFQRAALKDLRAAGVPDHAIKLTGNWLTIYGEPIMSAQGVRRYITDWHNAPVEPTN